MKVLGINDIAVIRVSADKRLFVDGYGEYYLVRKLVKPVTFIKRETISL